MHRKISPRTLKRVCGQTPRWTLLTGAGFTANWGTPVAQGVWSELISDTRIVRAPKIRQQLLSGCFDFEKVLARARLGEFGPDEERVFENIVRTVYTRIEEILQRHTKPVEAAEVGELLRWFRPNSPESKTGFIFTLNQDLLLERFLQIGHGNPDFNRPGVGEKDTRHQSYVTPIVVGTLTMDFDIDCLALPGTTNYVKLHGSVDWMTRGEYPALILGDGKLGQMQETLLLSIYYDIFRSVLSQGNKRLLVMGYGFGDMHINDAIAEAVSNHGLGVHIWDVRPPKQTYDVITDTHPAIWQGLVGYTQLPLAELIGTSEPLRADAWFLKELFDPSPGELRQGSVPGLQPPL